MIAKQKATYKKNNNEKLIARFIIEELKKAGVHLLFYKAYSTKSAYIKLDYGVSYSIRLSDHQGYDRLVYRYNIGTHIPKYRYELTDKYKWKFFFPATREGAMVLVNKILKHRNDKIKRLGVAEYVRLMEQEKARLGKEPGFWEKCKEI